MKDLSKFLKNYLDTLETTKDIDFANYNKKIMLVIFLKSFRHNYI